METNTTPVETLFVKAEDYSKTTIELFKLYAVDKTADVVSSLATQIAIYTVVVLFILTFNIGLALWLGDVLGKTYYGFFIIAGLYVLVCALVYAFRDQWVKTPVANSIIGQILTKKQHEK